MASLENTNGEVILTTDAQWKCSSTLTDGWETNNFYGHPSWQSAKVLSRAKNIGNIAKEAHWIWTKSSQDNPVYCRYKGRVIVISYCLVMIGNVKKYIL